MSYEGRRVAVRQIADDVPALQVVIATLCGVRLTVRAAALAEVIRGVFLGPANSQDGGSLGGPQTS
jgi:hypothetical protein